MKNLKVVVLGLSLWVLLPRLSHAEEFLYLPITRTPVIITAGFCGYRTATGSCHGGIDYDVRDDGDGIIAAAAGTVEAVRDGRPNTLHKIREYGNYVQILHDNGYRTIYGHLKNGSLLVRVGDHVRVGAPLGVGDNSGWSTGSHLHFEVRDPSGRKVDPYGESPSYPNCGANALWANCPPLSPADVDNDRDGWNLLSDCDDGNAAVHPFATELCDGVDEDCDTILDPWVALGTSCTVTPAPGCERSGTWVCSTDESTIVCDADTTVGDERCDSIDNDCDNQTDEDWRTGLASDLGKPCQVGTGECRREGVFICEPFGRGVVCSTDPGSPTQEICDGLDNDCNEYIDDFCLCTVPRPNCICRECDIPCSESDKHCLVIGLTPTNEIIYGCYLRGGCYFCPGPGVEGWICTSILTCADSALSSQFCLHPDAVFCADYCPFPWD